MLETIELRKVYKNKTAVDGVNLYLDPGESVGLLGPNGAGKSTTISMISTLIKPTSGDVKLNGQSVLKHPRIIRHELGVVPQEIALYQELSAVENLQFFGRIYGLKGKELELAVEEVLELVDLTDRKKERIKTYSGGMKRRINIAAALMHQPKIIIMDEPTVGIDPQSRNYILETVRRLNIEKKMTVLYTSHYMEEVEQLCDRIYIMDHGKVIASGRKEELKSILSAEDTIVLQLEEPCKELVDELKENNEIRKVDVDGNKTIKLIVPKTVNLLGHLFQAAERHGARIVNLNVQKPSLEDVFLHLTGRKLRD
jgi:ABC-2 type transport system ATP-binding protein